MIEDRPDEGDFPFIEVEKRLSVGVICFVVAVTVLFGNGVIPGSTPGMTTGNPLHTHPRPFEWSPFLHGFYCISRAGRYVTAGRGKKGRNPILIDTNGNEKDEDQYFLETSQHRIQR